MKLKKIAGFSGVYMLGIVAGVALTSAAISNDIKRKNSEYKQKYIQTKKENILKLKESLKYISSTDYSVDSAVTQTKLKQYLHTNLFDVNTDKVINSTGLVDGKKTSIIGNISNLNTQNNIINSTSSNILEQDLSGTAAIVFSEKNLKKEQIIKSYSNMKEESLAIYKKLINDSIYIFPCTLTPTKKDLWGRDFTYTRTDDASAQLSFNLPWDTGIEKIYPIKLPTLPVAENSNSGMPEEEQQKLMASDAEANDFFGGAVGISGDTAIAGAARESDGGSRAGAAYVFTLSGGIWSQQQKLVASDAEANDFFGDSINISGDTAIVGAYGEDDGGLNAGAVYIFTRSGGVWSQQQKLVASDAAADDYFGLSVSISGDTAIIGARGEDDGGSGAGAAYVFTRSGSVWSQQQKLIASDAEAYDSFGGKVSISGDTAIVGSYGEDDGGSKAGAAYVFTRSGGVWSEQQKLMASDAAANDSLGGSSVSIFGDTAIVGARGEDDGGSGAGAVYVFTRSGSIWSEQQKLVASDAAAGDTFGISGSISGDIVIVGAGGEDDGGSGAGAAYVFTRSGGIWSQQQKLVASDAESNDYLGSGVSISGDTAIAGAAKEGAGGLSAGAAYIFSPAKAENCP